MDCGIHNVTLKFTPYTPPLSSDTFKDAIIHMGENISDYPNVKNQTVTLDIERRCGKDIIEEGAIKIA